MSEKDKVNEAIKECTKLLAAVNVEAMVVAATKGKSAYRISNLHDDAETRRFMEYIFGLDETGTVVQASVYHHTDDGELKLVGGEGSDELN